MTKKRRKWLWAVLLLLVAAVGATALASRPSKFVREFQQFAQLNGLKQLGPDSEQYGAQSIGRPNAEAMAEEFARLAAAQGMLEGESYTSDEMFWTQYLYQPGKCSRTAEFTWTAEQGEVVIWVHEEDCPPPWQSFTDWLRSLGGR